MNRSWIAATAVAVISGLTLLALYFFPTPETEILRGQLLQLAASLGAVALLIGLANLFSVHLKKLRERADKSYQSGVFIVAFIITFLVALVLGPNASFGQGNGIVEPANWLFQNIQSPVEISLMALLSVSLLYAAARLLRRRANTFTLVFLGSFLLALLGSSLLVTGGYGQISEWIGIVSSWFARVPAAAGARGIIIGVALGAIATGIRILMGADRPYSG